jgi:hypothetical protein
VFRQFHVEGFVNQCVLDPSTTVDRLVFTSESIENIPAGFRARETYVFSGGDRLDEIFEIAEPGQDFEAYSRSRLTRRRSLRRSVRPSSADRQPSRIALECWLIRNTGPGSPWGA